MKKFITIFAVICSLNATSQQITFDPLTWEGWSTASKFSGDVYPGQIQDGTGYVFDAPLTKDTNGVISHPHMYKKPYINVYIVVGKKIKKISAPIVQGPRTHHGWTRLFLTRNVISEYNEDTELINFYYTEPVDIRVRQICDKTSSNIPLIRYEAYLSN